MLRPALDFLDRAVERADTQGILSGKLLSLVRHIVKFLCVDFTNKRGYSRQKHT